MSPYRAPVLDILEAVKVVGLVDVLEMPHFEEIDETTVGMALEEFGRLASEVIAPTNTLGDTQGATFDAALGTVTVPHAFHKAFSHFVDGGWAALAAPTEWGGGGFPALVGMAIQEMLASANLSLSLNPALSQSAIELLLDIGNESQKSRFLPPLLNGRWSGTMNLTEPDAGSDLGEVRMLAEPDGDCWRLTGTKIFITWGEHDLTENIIHLVLARTPGAPKGTRGLSLFVVPKRLVDAEGNMGTQNAIHCVRLERKLGIHGSPTCVLEYDQALGELVGPLHGGMQSMFRMMNAARLSIGMQGTSVGEAAYQQALEFAQSRRQGKDLAGSPRTAIINHPDVKRMLITMHALTVASRLIVYLSMAYKDKSRYAIDEGARTRAQEYVDLLTPVAKAWTTDMGVHVASLGIQVYGGMGYVEETGMAQYWRDSRIAPIYEGTNGIQAIDLVTRKLSRDGGSWVRTFIDDMEGTARTMDISELSESVELFEETVQRLRIATDWLLERTDLNQTDVFAAAYPYLELFGISVAGWLLLRRCQYRGDGVDGAQRLAEAGFFASQYLVRSQGLLRTIKAGAKYLEFPT